MTTVSGEALSFYYTLSEAEIKTECMIVLKALFPNQSVPEPDSVISSNWGCEPFARMSYSYVPVGGMSEDYDVMSQEEDKVHFAGEV